MLHLGGCQNDIRRENINLFGYININVEQLLKLPIANIYVFRDSTPA